MSPFAGRCCVRLAVVGAIVGSAIAFGSTAIAQVVPDATLGSTVSGASGGVQTITGGTTRETNLFHSFDRFSVPTNGTAFFDNAPNIQNILTRVTGGSISDIDGLIRANGAANLFLLNPNGIVFGQNARLDIGGSFVATTASSINFADGTQFSATPDTGAPLLTVSVPLGLQFGTGAGEIVNRASDEGLQVDTDRTLGLIGGNINLEGGRLTAAGGRVELGAVAALGVVGISPDNSGFRFSFPSDLALGDISLTDIAFVDVRAGGGGSIAVNARNLSITGGSQLTAGIRRNQGSVDAVAGDIDINVQDATTIDGVGQFPEGFLSSGIFNNVETGSTGKGGNININAGSLSLTNSGVISASVFGTGDAGNVYLSARDGVFLDRSTIFGTVEETGKGNSGIIDIKARSLTMANGGQILANTFGQGDAGNVKLEIVDTATFTGLSEPDIRSGIFSNVNSNSTGKGGDITLNTGNLFLGDGAQINTVSEGRGSAGNITIDVGDRIVIDGARTVQTAQGEQTFASGIFSELFSTTQELQSDRKAGDINIKARSLSLTQGAEIDSSTSGQGNAGNIFVRADNTIVLSNSNIFNNVETGAVGDGGTININTESLTLADGSQIQALVREASSTVPGGRGNGGKIVIDVLGLFDASGRNRIGVNTGRPSRVSTTVGGNAQGKGGDIDIKAGTLSFKDGASIITSTFGLGDAGKINMVVNNTATFSGVREDFVSGVFSQVASTAVGDGGTIDIKARSLDLTERAQINTSTLGQGNSGNIQITATDPNSSVSFSGGSIVKTNSLSTGNAGNITITADGDVAFVTEGIDSSLGLIQNNPTGQVLGDRKGGDINIKARSLFLTNSAQLTTSTYSQGNAGNISIDVSDTVSFDGIVGEYPSAAFSSVGQEGRGNGGNIIIKAHSLDLTNDGKLITSTFGQGNAGNITITVEDRISLDDSAIFSSVGQRGKGMGGNITIDARSLSLTNGGQLITSTLSGGQGNAGNIDIEVSDTVYFDGVGFDGVGNVFSSAAFSDVEKGGIGKGGDITIKARSLKLTNDAQVNASNFGQGNAGNITIGVRTLDLNGGYIFAQSASGDGGNIQLRIDKRLTLRNGSEISTTAGTEQQPGDGGDITIDSPLIIAALVDELNEDSNITANAFTGTGGNIKITSQGIFGILPRRTETPNTNDITASSELGIAGTIQLNSLEVDPSRDLVELPTGLVDASGLVAAGCPSGAENRFTVAGRGGLPPAPGDKLSSDALLTDWATLQTPETANRAPVETTTPVAANTTPTPIVEASSWQYDRNGAIILTSNNTTSPNSLEVTPTSCPSS